LERRADRYAHNRALDVRKDLCQRALGAQRYPRVITAVRTRLGCRTRCLWCLCSVGLHPRSISPSASRGQFISRRADRGIKHFVAGGGPRIGSGFGVRSKLRSSSRLDLACFSGAEMGAGSSAEAKARLHACMPSQ
jgi:hypothetical protein